MTKYLLHGTPRALIHTRATILHVTPLPCNNYILLYYNSENTV